MAYAELHEAAKKYGTVTALAGIDLQVGGGELLALLGPNGAGKTTAVRAMLGMTSLDAGEAKLFGLPPRTLAARRRTGVMLQTVEIPEALRVIEQIRLFSSYYPDPMPPPAVVEAAGLQGLETRLCGKLSGGQRRRVAFALAICGNPDLLFLDEPTTGLDVESRRMFWASIRAFVARGGSALLTTHYLEEADALADRIAILNRGRIIAQGRPSEVKARAAAGRVSCSTQLDPAVVMQLPGVAQVRTDKQRLEIFTTQPERTVHELLSRDPLLTGLEVSASGLEEALLILTEQDEKAMTEAA